MDPEKKKKLLLVLLAVAGLGAGSWYFFIRDTESVRARNVVTGPVQRRQRDMSTRTGKKDTRRARPRERDRSATVSERRQREPTERRTSSDRRRKGRRGVKVKKKKLVPAA